MGTPPPAYQPKSAALKSLIERGYFEQVSDIEAIDDALAAGMVTFYIGFDPTASSLHAGSLVQLMAMRLLQKHGHRPIAILGGGTAMIGDPSGKTEMRKILSAEEITANGESIFRQFGTLLHRDSGQENDALFLDNRDWLRGLHYIEFLRDIGRHFTVNRMVAVKTYRDRLDAEIPLSFLEFNYQLLQAYDFLQLYNTHGCTLQIGGSDQWGNIVAGIELIRRVTSETDQPGAAYGLTLPLLTTADGKKMGKTERGAIWIDAERLSPFDYYQYWISCDDRDVAKLLRLYTELPLAEIDALTETGGIALNAAKARLAVEATTLLHGAEAAAKAKQASKQAFGGGGDWSAVPCVKIEGAMRLVDLVTHPEIGAFKSKRDARQRIEGGAVKIDGDPITDPKAMIGENGEPVRLQSGKKIRLRIEFV